MKKRICSFLLALSIILGMSVAAGASASSDTVTAAKQPISFYKNYDLSTVGPQNATFLYPLTADMFEWSSGQDKAKGAVTTSQLRNVTADFSYPTSSSSKDIISEVSLVTDTVDGLKTVCVKVEFVDDFASVDSKDFDVTIFLRRSNIRMRNSDTTLSGTYGNPVINVYADKGYIDISNGSVLQPLEYIKSIEIGLGGGLIINGRLFEDKKYYGVASNGITSADESIIDKYSDIISIYTLKTINLKASGNIVMIEGYGNDCFVYSSSGKYLGATESWVEYSDKYYITDKKIDMSGTSSSSVSSSSSQSSSSSRASSASSSASSSSVSAGTAITVDSISKLTESAVSSARSSGSKVASVRVLSAASISPEAVSAMVRTAADSGISVRLDADTMNGNAVSGRLSLSPTSSTKLTSDINLGVYVSSTTVTNVKTKFEKWFKNNIEVVSLAHKGDYGMGVSIAVKINLTRLDTNKLYFYAYNAEKNQYQQIKAPNYSVDKNGYLHFNTSIGGEIIISEGILA